MNDKKTGQAMPSINYYQDRSIVLVYYNSLGPFANLPQNFFKIKIFQYNGYFFCFDP